MSLVLLGLLSVALPAGLQVLPQPKQVEELGAEVALKGPVTVYLAAGQAHEDDAHFAARTLISALDEAGVQARLEVSGPDGAGWVFMGRPEGDEKLAALAKARGLALTDDMAAEGYALSVEGDGVVLIAETPAGLLYGVQTLRQLLRPAREGVELPALRVHDWPSLRLRGIMHDTSRGQVPTLETAKRIIDFCSYYKINLYGPFIEHTFAWEGHEAIWRGSGAWSAEDFVELATYARPRNVIIVPQLEAMGHQTHILTKEPYKELAETGGWSFAPAVEGTYTLLDDLMGQMSRAFPFHPYFGIGCDEVYDMGQGRSKELMEKLGGKGPLFTYHIGRLNEILKAYGRRPMMWGDMMLNHPETMGQVPRDVIILDWHYGATERYPSVKQFRDAGYEVVVCPALSSWVRIFPDYVNGFANIQNLIAEGQRNGALGSMTCNWGDWGAENLVDYNWLGWAWAAACSWAEAESQSRDEFGYDFCRTFYGNASRRLAEAQWLLAEANLAFPWGRSPLNHFHGDPFAGELAQSWPSPRRADKLAGLIAEAAEDLDRGGDRVRAHEETVAYLRHPVRRYRYVVDRVRGMSAACEAYTAAYQAADDAERRDAELRRCLDLLTGLRAELAACRDEFGELWLRANRPEGLDFDLGKFDAQLAAYDKRIEALRVAMENGALPEPGELGLASRTRRAGLAVVPGDVAAGEKWWDERWTRRVALRLEAGDVDRPVMPVVLQMDLAALGGQAVAAGSPRLVVDGKDYPAQIVPLWTSEGVEEGAGVAFVLPRPIAKGQTLEAELYWAPEGAALPAAETDLSARLDGDRVWVENSRMRVMIGSEGAHLYEWHVKALGDRDITQPGTEDWCGFLDLNWVRKTPFELRLLADGPVAAVVQAVEEGGWEKCVTVYAGLPLVEMKTSEPVTWMWNYDNPDSFAADGPTPGWGRFADGTEAAVPKGGEQVHLRPGKRVRWGAKYREDGLTLGLITPGADTDMRIGPGGGWGGVGIEQSAGADWFVTYCDTTEGKWETVAALAGALRLETPVRVVAGRPESQP